MLGSLVSDENYAIGLKDNKQIIFIYL